MIPHLRQSFNRNFTPEKYVAFLENLDRACGTHVKFRNCETPCFFPAELLERLASAGHDLIHQLVDSSAYRPVSSKCIPKEFDAPGETPRPLFIQADFGLVRGATGELEPRLVEIQGFASLYAYQVALAQTYLPSYGLSPDFRFLVGAQSLE